MSQSIRLSKTILYSLVFLLFFQLVADFIETIYAFGLLGTNIPPEIVCILLFFTPVILLFFPFGLPRKAGYLLVIGAALMRALEVSLDKGGKMITSGLGTGLLLVILPIWLGQLADDGEESVIEMGAGLAAGVAGSILLRALGAGTDRSLLVPWLSWILAAAAGILAIWFLRERTPSRPTQEDPGASFGWSAWLSTGVMGVMAVLYFGFTSPTVLARWSGVDYRLVLELLFLSMSVFAAALALGGLARLPQPASWIWNGLFLLSGTLAIWINQMRYPVDNLSFPVDQPVLTLIQQAPFFLMILLSPVALYDFLLLCKEIQIRRPYPRNLAGGFIVGVLFFLIVAFTQVFTTVYDYIPVVGPALRDRFWAVFLFTGLGMALPTLNLKPIKDILPQDNFKFLFIPLVGIALLGATLWAIYQQPAPAAPANQTVLRVVTYNLQQGYSADGKRSYLPQLAEIKSLNPDILGLEESDVARFSGGNADLVRTISEGLGMTAYYGPKTVSGTFGIALLTRYPLENPHTFYMTSVGEQTAAIEAQITIAGKPYTILVTHLGNDGPFIQQQQVLSRLKGKPNIIAMGDFNFTPETPQYALTVQSLKDAWVQMGSPVTVGVDPKNVIDHVFVSPGMNVKSAVYINSPVSDHPALEVIFVP